MKNKSLAFFNETIYPGESVSLAMPLPELFSCAPLYMPIKVIHGRQQGPCMLITAAMHGNELNGTEIINRLLQHSTLKNLRGTLIAVPVVNVYGLISRSRYLPGDVELTRSFPGSTTGTHAARLANLLVTEILSKADICIDLQTGLLNYTNFPQIYVDVEDDTARQLAEQFKTPVISNMEYPHGSFQLAAKENNIPTLIYEAGEAMRFDEHAIKVGLNGLLKIMRSLAMLAKNNRKEPKLNTGFLAEKEIWVRASTSGISHSKLKLGAYVKKNDELCVIKDPFGTTEDVAILSPEDAIVVGKNNLPLIHEGEGLFQLAVFSKMQDTAEHLEVWHNNRVTK